MNAALMTRTVALALVVLAQAACEGCDPVAPPPPNEGEGEGEGEGEVNACVAIEEGPGFQISSKADLRWKRATPLKNDLIVGLGLDERSVCSELGLDGFCFSLIHLVPLGANDPVKAAMYRPVSEPGATAPLAFDRVVLSACGERADADTVAVPAARVVWRTIDLDAASLDPTDPAIATDVRGLYRRLLARDPTAEELSLVASLAEDVNGTPTSPRDLAKMACYAVATTSEFLFH